MLCVNTCVYTNFRTRSSRNLHIRIAAIVIYHSYKLFSRFHAINRKNKLHYSAVACNADLKECDIKY
jgi:hypothetical protein